MAQAPGLSFAERMRAGNRLPHLEEMARLHQMLHQRSVGGLSSLMAQLADSIRGTDHLGKQ